MTANIPTERDPRFDNPDMRLYAVHCMGWMTLIESPDRDEAIEAAKQIASSGSLFPSDIEEVCNGVEDDSDGFQGIRIATAEDIEQFRLMTEPMPEPKTYTWHVWFTDGADAVVDSTRADVGEFIDNDIADIGDVAAIRAIERVDR